MKKSAQVKAVAIKNEKSASEKIEVNEAKNLKAINKNPLPTHSEKLESDKKLDSCKQNKSKLSCCSKTTVIAQVDIGWGNVLFIRGEGSHLSWEKGIPMKNTGSDQWTWASDKADKTTHFKFLINDEVWAHGDNGSIAIGEKVSVRPFFQ